MDLIRNTQKTKQEPWRASGSLGQRGLPTSLEAVMDGKLKMGGGLLEHSEDYIPATAECVTVTPERLGRQKQKSTNERKKCDLILLAI